MRKLFYKLIITVLCLSCVLAFNSNAFADVDDIIVETAPVARFKGNWQEIGRQVGHTYPEYIIEFGNLMNMILFFAGPGSGWSPQAYYDEIENLIPQSIKDHMQGLAMGLTEVRPMRYDRAWELVLTQNFFTELLNMNSYMSSIPKATASEVLGCTAFVVSSGSETFLCHNTDATPGTGDNIVVIMYWEPDNGDNAYMTMDPPGWADVAFALNDQGIGITMNLGSPNMDAKIGLPINYMIRYVMEHAATFEEAIGYFEDFLADGNNYGTGGALVHLVDFNDSAMAKIQVRSETIEVTYGQVSAHDYTYIASANHYVGDFNPDPDYYYESSFERYERLLELMEQVETFDLESCWSILSDTRGGEASNNTISRIGDSTVSLFSTIFTADGLYYTMGPPHAYQAKYGQPQFVDFAELSATNLASFTALPKSGKVILNWEIETADDVTGFNLLRSTAQNGNYGQINDSLIQVEESVTSYEDTGLKNRQRYYYKLEVIDLDGVKTMHGTVCATPKLIYGIIK
jgi:hypothetical protein